MRATAATYDPVLLEVMSNEFGAIADEMAYIIMRTGRSFAAHEGGDFMVGLLDKDGNLIERGRFGIATWYVPMVIPFVLEKFGGKFKPGDMVITNDPYGGGSHLNDIVLVSPIFWEDELVGFTGAALHHLDVGGRAAGNMSSRSGEVYEEGIRLPCVLLYSGGVPSRGLFETIEANSRSGDDLMGDLNAKIVACRRGEEGYLRLIRKYGLAAVKAYGKHLIDYTERQMRAAIAALPDGEWYGETHTDDDGAQGPGPKIAQRLIIQGDRMTVDYTGTDPQVPTAINMPPAMTRMRVVEPMRNVLGVDCPVNAGMWNVADIVCPEGTLLNPRFPAAVGARALSGFAQRDLLLATFSAAAPHRVPAADCGPNGILVYTAPQPGTTPKVLFDLYQCGCGGRPNGDGPDGGGANFPGGGLLETPVEAIERELPVRMEGFGFHTDATGAGKFRGSISIRRAWRFLEDGTVHIRNYHFEHVAYGVGGGANGSKSHVYIESGGTTRELTGDAHIELEVKAGDVISHVFAGAGGHGNPLERDLQRILDDVLDEKISLAHAEREYGVVIDPNTRRIDEAATAKHRAAWSPPPSAEPSVQPISFKKL